MTEPFTYHDDGGDELEPERMEEVCRYYLDLGPKQVEHVTQLLGPSSCGGYDVLWEKSDVTEEIPIAVAWLPRGELEGFELWQALALAYWSIRKEGELWDGYDCVEVIDAPDGLVDAEAFKAVLAAVWPDEGDANA